ncbi:MAG: hypothetical protein GX635_06705 [Synergistaceae bacterium]|nr:hypothetical protein [Synergistaceae bacterium]
MGKKGILFLVWFLGFVSAVEGAATWYNAYTGGMWNNPGSALIDTMLYNRMMAETSLKKMQRTPSGGVGASGQVRTLYRPSSSQSSIPGKVAAVLSNDNATKKELTVFFKEGLQSFEQFAQQAGRPYDLGFSMAFFAGVCIGLTTENEVDDDAILAAASQMDKLLAEQSGIAEASDTQRREFAEVLACMAVFALAGHTQAEEAGDDEAVESFKQFARQSMIEILGMDTNRLRMDGRGIRIIQ